MQHMVAIVMALPYQNSILEIKKMHYAISVLLAAT